LIFVWKSFIFPILSGKKAGFCPKKERRVWKMRTTDMADELFSGATQPLPAGHPRKPYVSHH